jgi:hypothetical protein
MTKRSPFSLLDPIIPSRFRSKLFQVTLQLGRRLDLANGRYANYDAPVLLLGSPRGGTTLMANIIGAHPLVYMFHERFTRGKQSYDDTFAASANAAVFKRSFLQFIPHHVKSTNMRWGVKIVTHIWKREDFDRFLAAFPALQILFVVRDGRDTVLSLLSRSPYIRTPEEAFERWIESVDVFNYLKSKAGERFFWYYYEDLVSDPEKQVRAICDFLELSFEPRTLDYHDWPGLGSYEIAPITADKVNKWQQQALPEVAPQLVSRFEHALQSMGYESNGTPWNTGSELAREKP